MRTLSDTDSPSGAESSADIAVEEVAIGIRRIAEVVDGAVGRCSAEDYIVGRWLRVDGIVERWEVIGIAES